MTDPVTRRAAVIRDALLALASDVRRAAERGDRADCFADHARMAAALGEELQSLAQAAAEIDAGEPRERSAS